MKKYIMFGIIALFLVGLSIAGFLGNEAEARSKLTEYKSIREKTINTTQTSYTETYKGCEIEYDSEELDCEVCYEYTILNVNMSEVQGKTKRIDGKNVDLIDTNQNITDNVCFKIGFNETDNSINQKRDSFIYNTKEDVIPKVIIEYEI